MASEPSSSYEPEVLTPLEQRRYERRLKSGAEVFKMMESLRSLSALPQGWDGYNASPVSRQVMDNIYEVLNGCQDEDLLGWQAYPEVNGTLMLQNDELRAGMNLGDRTFSYFTLHDNMVSGDDDIAFTVPVFINVLRTIND